MRASRTGRTRSMRVSLTWAGLSLFASGIASGQEANPAQATAEKQAATPGPRNNVRPAIKWQRYDYTCEGGAKITVYVHDTVAKVRTQDHMFMMRQAGSADGNRYSDGKILWWSKGDMGFLQEDKPDGDGKMLVKECVRDKPADSAKP
jgi:membrane-bound inhibitor of C-type lysozyme